MMPAGITKPAVSKPTSYDTSDAPPQRLRRYDTGAIVSATGTR